jgi:cell division protein FtsQ
VRKLVSQTRPRNARTSTRKVRKQQHLLDVKVRSRKAAQQRNRFLVICLCKLILFAATVGGAVYGIRIGLERFLWANPDYNLTDVQITSDGTLLRSAIMETAGIQEGANIFSVNLSEARAKLSQLPQVDRVEIQRVLPNRISVTISERKPIAWIAPKGIEDPSTSDQSFLIDARGTLMQSKTLLPEYLHLPVIYGVQTGNLAAGESVQLPEMKSALNLIRLNSDNTRFQIRTIDLAKGYCMVVSGRSRAQITFGLDRVDAQLERLSILLDRVEESKREIQTVNLMVERNVPVTFVPAPEEIPVAEPAAALPATPQKMPVRKAEPVKPAAREVPLKKTPPVVKRATAVSSQKPKSNAQR